MWGVGGGCGGTDVDNKFVFINSFLFLFFVFLLYEIYAPMAHLRKDALRPHYYYYYYYSIAKTTS